MKAVIYARVSTFEQAESGLGIAAQVERCRSFADYRGHEVVAVFDENGVSGTQGPADRPAMGQALALLAAGEADVLVCSKLDRLGRDVRDLLELVELADRQGWGLAVLDLGGGGELDTTTANGRMVFGFMCVLAQWERETTAERTAAALQAKKAQGFRLGRPVEQSAAARQRVRELRAGGASLAATARALTEEGIPTARGGRWHAATVKRMEGSDALDAEAAAAR